MNPDPRLFFDYGLSQIPHMLTLLDRNPHSATYGCFDRDYWHYRTTDFPIGMSQECVLPLALAYASNGTPYSGVSIVRDWIRAGIQFAASSAHGNGSCDDYYLYEQALGATTFSFLAMVIARRLIDLHDEPVDRFLTKRADWLASARESGRLANHHALVAWGLVELSEQLDRPRWTQAIRARVNEILAWQTDEGWFPEYEGFDPGYHSLTLGCLAEIHERPAYASPALKAALIKGVDLAREFIHPDGSHGGEYGHRNTYNFFPHGYERIGAWYPPALELNTRFLTGLREGRFPAFGDDRILAHHAWSFMLAAEHFVPRTASDLASPRTPTVWLPQAATLIKRRHGFELYANLRKGGVFKLFLDGHLICSDSQCSILIQHGGDRCDNLVAHLPTASAWTVTNAAVTTRGVFSHSRLRQMTPLKLIGLRLVMGAAGRLFPNFVRAILQRLLIHPKPDPAYSFERSFLWDQDSLTVRDRIRMPDRDIDKAIIHFGVDQSSSYTAMGRVFAPAALRTPVTVDPSTAPRDAEGHIAIERHFSSIGPTSPRINDAGAT